MTTTDTLKHYGEALVEQSRTGLLAAIGAGDAAVEAARTVVEGLRARAEALPGEAQVQADLAVKEARTLAEQARERAEQARERAAAAAGTVKPEHVLDTVVTLVAAARTQAVHALTELAGRGEKVVGELRGRTDQTVDAAVDTVAATVEDTLAEAGDAVVTASNTVTSMAQKTAAKADRVAEEAAQDTEAAAQATKRRVRTATAKAEAPVRKPRGQRSPEAAATVSDTPVPDPTAIPAKSTPSTDGPI
jgi:heparin binding hemagglutinin HbhA